MSGKPCLARKASRRFARRRLAAWFKYHPEHVRRMVWRDGLPAHKAGRKGKLYFLKEEVMAWLREQSIT